ncbi:hypothetical protein ACQEVG_11870 [Streptomyces sp. CA-135486]|uniref:hypothetical protein n=1 Tax=Streptomyces sp. CA-135486 TaxID=3240049 RepID=UPI003D92B757
MRIPVFVSCPTDLNPEQEIVRGYLFDWIENNSLTAHTLGRSDYSRQSTLHEVLVLGKRCCGALVLGFEQMYSDKLFKKRGTSAESQVKGVSLPTPWNHLEAGIMYAQRIPLLIFREEGISGGIFDSGTVDGFVHSMPSVEELGKDPRTESMLQRWSGEVMNNYYNV